MYGDMSNRVVDAKHLLDQTSPDHVKQTSRHQQPVLASSEWQPTGHMPSAFGYGLPHNSLAAVHTSGHPEASVHHSSYRLTQSAGPATFPKPAGNSTLPRHNTNAAPVAPTPKQHSSARLPPPWQRRPLVLILILALACMTMLSLHQHFALQHIAHKVSQHRLPADVQIHRLQEKVNRLSDKLEQADGKIQDLELRISTLRKTSKEAQLTASQRETALCRQQLQQQREQQNQGNQKQKQKQQQQT